jgi:hypothetical protein
VRRPAAPDFLVKPRYQRQLRRRYAHDQPVLVFSLGKVGTTSIARMIQDSGRSTLHCHRIAVGRAPDPRWPTGRGRPYPAWRGEAAREMLQTGAWDVVCGVRDPVARAVSKLFQIGGDWEREPDVDSAVQALTENLVDLFDAERADLDWFDVQLAPVTGVDVYAQPFDTCEGWRIDERGRFRVLVIRFEDLARVAGPVLASFLSLPSVPTVPHRNEGDAKSYADLYKRFKSTAQLPARVLDAAYGSQLATHFYSEAELERFRSHWERNR